MTKTTHYRLIGMLLLVATSLSAWAVKRLTVQGVEYTTISDQEAVACLTKMAQNDVVILENVSIDKKNVYKVVRVGKAYFKENYYLASLSIPNSVRQIDGGAVRGCSNLVTVIFPDQPCVISEGAFGGCKNIRSIMTQSGSAAGLDYVLAMLDSSCPVKTNPQPLIGHKPTPPRPTPPNPDEPILAEDEDVDIDIPVNTDLDKRTFVLIIGNEEYKKINANVPYAAHDAEVFKDYCVNIFGINSKQIDLYTNATYGDFIDGIDKLKNRLSAFNGKGKAIVYYAGHGIPDVKNNSAYLLPVDGRDSRTAYSLNDLYAELNNVPSEQILVFMDACFTGANRDGSMLSEDRGVAVEVKESVPKGNMFVLTAATGKETATCDKERKHGIFTYYLLQHLRRTQGLTDLGTLTSYVQEKVQQRSVIINDGKSQTPTAIPSPKISETWKNIKLRR